MRWFAALIVTFLFVPVLAEERFVRVDFDLDVVDPIKVYESARDALLTKHGYTDEQVLALLRPNDVVDLRVCIELLIYERLAAESDGVRLVRSVIDRNVKRETSPLAGPIGAEAAK